MYLYCTSLVMHICLNGPLYLLNLNAFTTSPHLQIKVEPCELCLLDRNVSIDEAN